MNIRISHVSGVVLGFCLLIAAPLIAQDAPKPGEHICFRGRPRPACKRFMLIEVGFYPRLVGNRRFGRFTTSSGAEVEYSDDATSPREFTGELGAMANIGSRNAMGATLLVGTGLAQGGVKLRYRRWLTPRGIALDIGSGIASGTVPIVSTSDVAINAADYGAISLRFDYGHSNGGNSTALYAGVRLGSRPAVFAAAGAAVTLVLLIATLSISGYQ